MKLIQKALKLNKENYYKVHISLVSILLQINLTKTEIELLSKFMSLDASLIEEDMFNSYARKQVRENLKMSHSSISNHIASMINKGALSKNKITNRILVDPKLIPESNSQGYQIAIINQ